MYFLIALGIFFIIVAGTWFLGTWNIFLNLITTIIAATVASSTFEMVAQMIDDNNPSYTYIADFVSLWLVFVFVFIALRVCAELTTKYRMKMNIFVDMAMRTGLSILMAWIFICFTFFTLHTAPLPVDGALGSFQQTPDSRNLVIGPGRLWMSYVSSRSRGALSEFKKPLLLEADQREMHPDDEGLNCRIFDPNGEFIFKYHERRVILSGEDSLRVER